MQRWLANAVADTLEPSVYRFILRYSLAEQIYLVVVTLLSFPFLYYSLDLPKQIVNEAIAGKHFPHAFFGVELDQIEYLLALCAIFLALVIVNGWFKYHLNVRKGRVGERMLRRLRYELYQRVLRFPLRHFDRTATGEIIAMMTAELEPVGGFIGDSLALPIAQAGTLLTIFLFMFIQNPTLGAAAVALYPIQAYVIPKLQRRIRVLGRERVRKMRALSDRIGESIASQVEIRTNAGARHQLADISHRLGEIYEIRFEIYNRKFFVKFLNNFLGQMTPFFFYALGGYFVIAGSLSFGALVAVLAAFKELSAPWKELLDFYQNQQDVSIKYEQVVEQFQVAGMIEPRHLLDEPERLEPLRGEVVAEGVSLADGDGIHQLDGVSFAFALGEHVAVVGPSNSGKSRIPQLLARLYAPTSGRITVGGADLNSLPLTVTGRVVGYVGPNTHLFAASLRDNLLLGLRHGPLDSTAPGTAERARALIEARASGNLELDIAADWTNYAQAGVADAAELERRIIAVMRIADLDQDIYLLGLRGRLDRDRHRQAAEQLLQARQRFEARLAAPELAALVERFDADRYNASASIGENLLFGTPLDPRLADEALPENPHLNRVLQQTGLRRDLLGIGVKIAEAMVELFADLPPEHGFFEEYAVVGAEDLPELERVLARRERVGITRLAERDRARLLGLALKLVAERDRLGLIDAEMQSRLVSARHRFAAELPDEMTDAVEFFDPERYVAAARVEENILFGTVRAGDSESRERVESAIGEVLDELGLRDTIMAIGLDYMVGTGGSRLSPAQRQKVAIARAVLKRPMLLALDEATAVLDPAAETRVFDALRAEFAPGESGTGEEPRSIVAALPRASLARSFDRVLVMEQGRLIQQGPYGELDHEDGPLAPLMAAE